MDYSKQIKLLENAINKSIELKSDYVVLMVNTLFDENINMLSASVSEQISVSDLSYKDLLQIETNFRMSCEYYRFYHSAAEFLGSILLGELDVEKKLLLYATTHIDKTNNGRSVLPLIANKQNVISLTGDTYALTITKNKHDYFRILEGIVPIPVTYKYEENKEYLLKYPAIVKPTLECCAKGVTLVSNFNELVKECEKLTNNLNQNIIIQEFIDGIEINVPILKMNEEYLPLPPTVIAPNNNCDILTEKIIKEKNYHYIEPKDQGYPLTSDIIKLVHKYSILISKQLNLGGLSRIDFRLDKKGEAYVFDIASIPYLTQSDACCLSIKHLFPENPLALYQALIGSVL
ncbi:ATP-grasp domain-containing protein [Enterococcus crotali]|uniref:ATP-grasp domain-containing protein n=1 Tax=Enterococcus crotali TaxID=1453587 RepID=UPI00047038C3|nr:ATP-grasp domain-containing protein [Enterococcus crotali]